MSEGDRDTLLVRAVRLIHDLIPQAADDREIAGHVAEWLDLLPGIPARDVRRVWTLMWPTADDFRQDLGSGHLDLIRDPCVQVVRAVTHAAPRVDEAEPILRYTLHWMTSDPRPRCGRIAGGTLAFAAPYPECRDPMALKPFFELCLAHRVMGAEALAARLEGHGKDDLLPDLVPTAAREADDWPAEPDEFLGRQDAARLLGWTAHTLSTRKSEGKLPSYCIVDGRRGRTTYSRNGLLRFREELARRGG